MIIGEVKRIIFEFVFYVLVNVYEFVKFWWHQGHRDGRKRLPPIQKPFLTLSATELAVMIRQQKVTSEELVRACIDRCRETQGLINAVVDDRFNDAIEDAKKADQMVKTCTDVNKLAKEKPFLGVPFTTKDAMGIEGLLADNGNLYYKGVRAPEDAKCVARMRAAGAIPLATTNVPEMCMWVESANRMHGRTNNPYDLHRTPGGSTGGEGALIAACGTVIGIGTDIAGSVRTPSACCGIYGHKSSPGYISREGMLPPGPQEAKSKIGIVGPMGRSVEDLRGMLDIMCDNPGVLKLSQKVDVKKLRFFYSQNEGAKYFSAVSTEMSEQVMRSVRILENELGAKPSVLPRATDLYTSLEAWFSTIEKIGIPKLKTTYDSPEKQWEPMTEFFKVLAGQSDRNMYTIYITAVDEIMRKDKYKLEECAKKFEEFKKSMEDLLGADGVAIIPSLFTTAPFHHGMMCHPMYFSYAGIINALRFPSTIIPTGLSHTGIPLSVQIIANHGNDRLTLAVAEYLDKYFGGFVPPSEVLGK